MDYALSGNGGEGWQGVKGKIVVFNGITEARKTAIRISNNTGKKVTIGRVTWAKDYYGKKMGIKKISVVETVSPAPQKKLSDFKPKKKPAPKRPK